MQITGEEGTFMSSFLILDPARNTEDLSGKMSQTKLKVMLAIPRGVNLSIPKQEFKSAN